MLSAGMATAMSPEILLMDEWFLAGDADFMKKADYITSNEPIEQRVNTRIYTAALADLNKREPKEKLWKELDKDFRAVDPDLHIKKH